MNKTEKHYFGQQALPPGESTVTLRGFLYKTPDGAWILSQEPQLKSCCAGSHSKVKEQFYLIGEFTDSPAATVAEVTGLFKIEPRYSESGTLIQYYTLHDAVRVTKEMDYTILVWFGVVLLGMLVSVRFFQHWRRVSRKI